MDPSGVPLPLNFLRADALQFLPTSDSKSLATNQGRLENVAVGAPPTASKVSIQNPHGFPGHAVT